jgi:hypothetical protein
MGKPTNYPECSIDRLTNKSIILSDRVEIAAEYIRKVIVFNKPTCYSRSSRMYRHTFCSCLHDIFEAMEENRKISIINCIALYLVTYTTSGRQNQGAVFSSWVTYRANIIEKNKDTRNLFILPLIRDNVTASYNGDIPRLWICRNALQWILNIKCDRWKSLMSQAEMSCTYTHHLENKQPNNSISDEMKSSLNNFFNDMEELSCPRATRVVRSITGKEELRDKDEVKELPTNLTRRSLYRRWIWRRGLLPKQMVME